MTDVLIVGGGIVGLATAYSLVRQFPQKSVVLLEKERDLGRHQTGHNSGVLHSGVYYKPGSLKATNCRLGREAMLAFCAQEGIQTRICGKVIVAVDEGEVTQLARLAERAQANGVPCEMTDRSRLAELEPHVAGVRALYLPQAGIVDFKDVCARLAAHVREAGGQVDTGVEVCGLRESSSEVTVETNAGVFHACYVVNCAGLHSDRVAALASGRAAARIIPFRGEYYRLKPAAEHLCNNLIYPVPDPQFPFLGVHFTRTIHGVVEAGPNAVLAFAREGYRKTDISARDLLGTVTYPGFIKMASRHWRMGIGEMWRSLNKAAFVKALQRMMPAVTAEQLTPYPAGVRAQAVAADGSMLDDFAFQETPRTVHVINAPSPAATAALSIGRSILERLGSRFA